jgi:hypothetical protein
MIELGREAETFDAPGQSLFRQGAQRSGGSRHRRDRIDPGRRAVGLLHCRWHRIAVSGVAKGYGWA